MTKTFVLLALCLIACGGEPAPASAPAAPATPAAPSGPAAPPTVAPAAPAAPVAPTTPPLPTDPVAAADPAAADPTLGDPTALCAAYYDGEVRDALARAEAGALEHPGVTVRTSLGVGERAGFIAACSAQPPERLRCFTAYAAGHMDDCLQVILTPTPEMAVIVPLNNQTIEDLRALAATLPPATP